MAWHKEIPGLTWAELLDRWRCHEPEEPGYDDGYLEELAIELCTRAPDGIAFLKSQLGQLDADRVTAAILGLTFPPLDDPAVPQALRDLLSDDRPEVVAAAIRGLYDLGESDSLPRIAAMLPAPSPHVRCAALEYVRRMDPDRAKDVLLSALADDDYLVRMCAVDELDEYGDPATIPAIRPLLDDAHPYVRQAAETVVENLAALAEAVS